MFSKVHPKAMIIGTIVLVAVALVTYVLPIIGLILCLFATIPGIIMWHKSIATFGIGALLTVVITTLLGNTFVLSAMILVLLLSFVIGQLLKERTSKERILYITTMYISIVTLIVFMLLQAFKKIPNTEVLIKPAKDAMNNAIVNSGVESDYKIILEEGFRQMAVQLPSYIIIIVFLLVLMNIIITFPILRKFKVATPMFRPLFAWQMNRTLLWIYMIVLVCVMFAIEPSIFQSIVLNFEVVLSLLMYIQGLSLIHFFGKAKRLPDAVSILLMVVGTVISPFTHMVSLLGVLDLGINLKRMIKK